MLRDQGSGGAGALPAGVRTTAAEPTGRLVSHTIVRQGFQIEPLGAFSLQAAARFWGGFTPAAHEGLDTQGHLHMAFPAEGSWRTVGVCVQQAGEGSAVS